MPVDKEKTPSFWHYKSMRLYLTFAFGLTVFGSTMNRNTLSMAMVCMVNSNITTASDQSSSDNNSTCSSASDLQQVYHGTFNWGSFEQGLMFSAMFIGGIFTTLPGGWLADRYDPKTLVIFGVFCSTAGCFLSPITATDGGYVGLIILRFIMGFLGSAVYPSLSAISARWIPPAERSTVIALYSAGSQVGSIIGMPLNALLCSSNFLGGWPAIFYVNGAVGLLSMVIWIIVVSNRPDSNRFITEREKNYITMSLENQNLGNKKDVTRKIPLKQMMTSSAVWSLFIMMFSYAMMSTTLSTYIPTYFKEALSLSLLNNGLFAALPYLLQWLGKILFSVVADYMKKHTKLSQTLVCKLFNTICCVGASVFLIACAYMDCSTAGLAIAFLSMATFLMSANVPGFMTSVISIAPPFAGTIMALTIMFAQVSAFMSPLIVAALTPQGTAEQWKHVFILMAGFLLVSGVVFVIFGSATTQEWAKLSKSNTMVNVLDGKDVKAFTKKDNTEKFEMSSVEKVQYFDNKHNNFDEVEFNVDKVMHL